MKTFVCGPADTGCWNYGVKVADDCDYGGETRLYDHADGPLCVVCGVPKGTVDYERHHAAHAARTGHGLGTGACEDTCGHDGSRYLKTPGVIDWYVHTPGDSTDWSVGHWYVGIWFPGTLADAIRESDLLNERSWVRGWQAVP